jgi:threonine synthase
VLCTPGGRALPTHHGGVAPPSAAAPPDAAARADRHGLFADPHTGVALAALEKLVAAGTIGRGQRAVVVSTASGLKFADFKVGYHEGRLPAVDAGAARWRNLPVELPADYDAVRDAVRRGLDSSPAR